MILSKTIAKAEKLTGSVAVKSGQTYYFKFNQYTLSFCANGRIEDDMNSDYWPGTFHDNLTQAFKFIEKRT